MSRRRARWASGFAGCAAALGLALAVALPAGAQAPVPQGSEFQVNSHTPNGQTYPSVAMQPGGDFVVAWESYTSPGTDTSSSSIQARRFTSDGSALGAQFQVNTYTTGFSGYPPSRLPTTEPSSWPGGATDRSGPIRASTPSRRSASPRTGRRKGRRVPGQHLYDVPAAKSLRGGGCRRGLRRGVDEHRFVRDGHRAGTASRASATPRTERLRAASSRSTATRRATSRSSRLPWRRMPMGISWWCGTASGRSGTDTSVQHPGPALRLGWIRARRAVPGQCLYDEPSVPPSRGSGRRRGLRRGVGQRRLAGDGQRQLQRARPALRVERIVARLAVPGQRLHDGIPEVTSVAADADRDFVVVWDNMGSFGTDTSAHERSGPALRRRMDRARARSSRSTATPPAIRGFPPWRPPPAGDFVVVWDSFGSFGPDTDTSSILGQRFGVPAPVPPPVPAMSGATRFALGAALLLLGAGYALRRRS